MSIAHRRDAAIQARDRFGLRCATCEVSITSLPDWHDGQAFCCAGCLAGGPCICPGDAREAAMGRRVTIQGEDRRTESFRLALPDDEHATADTLSIASEAGRALVGARVGDVVYVETGGRRRWAVVLHVA